MSDLISRQDAINVLDVMCHTIAEKEVRKGVSMAWEQIKELPSAQPCTEQISKTYTDGFDDGYAQCRHDAIDATWKEPSYSDPINILTEVRDRIENLPSAQPNSTLTQFNSIKNELNDTISRQSAIHINEEYHGRMPNEINFEIYKKLKQLPSAQPERKTGRWKKISPAGIYECDLCGKNVMTKDIDAYDFCHGCGAKMEVEHER